MWPRLVASDPDWCLTVVGRQPSPELLAAARDPRVTAAGFVDDVRPHLAAAQVCVYPIRDGGGTRLKVLDAFSMGKPLVATRLAVEGIEAVDGVHYLSAETAEEFVDGDAEHQGGDSRKAAAQVVAKEASLDVAAQHRHPGAHHDRYWRPLHHPDQMEELVDGGREICVQVPHDRRTAVE